MLADIIFDIDGVLLKKKEHDFKVFAENSKINYAQAEKVFKEVFFECSIGERDLKEVITPLLINWGWEASVEEFLEKWFESDFEVNEKLLEKTQELNRRGHRLHVASNQEKHRAQFLAERLLNQMDLEKSFMSWEMGVDKSNARFFERIIDGLKNDPEKIYFFDDNLAYVKVARKTGIQAVLFEKTEDVEKFVK